MYCGGDFSVPLQGKVLTGFIKENGRFTGCTSGYTVQACLLVTCGLHHIDRLESLDVSVIVHPTNFLPAGFSFTNMIDGFAFTATPLTRENGNLNGPLFLYRARKSIWYSANSPAYHFMLAKPPVRQSLYWSLKAVDMHSWFKTVSSSIRPTSGKCASFKWESRYRSTHAI